MHLPTTLTRIHITGSPGSGKSTLAKQISTRHHLPCYDLDEVAYEGGFGRKITLETRLATLATITAQPAWVTEGVFLWWTAGLMDAADVIIWLDLPFYINGWRIVTRHFRLNWAGTNRHPDTGKMVRFLWHVMRMQLRATPIPPKAPDDDAATTRAGTAEFLRAYAAKVIHCQSPADVAHVAAHVLAHMGKARSP